MLWRMALLILLLLAMPAWGVETTTTFFHEPYSYAVPDRSVRIRAVISDRKNISRVTCVVAGSAGLPGTPVQMELDQGSKFTYSVLLPPQPANSYQLRYHFQVQLESGESKSREYSTPIRQDVVPGWQPEPAVPSQKKIARAPVADPSPPPPVVTEPTANPVSELEPSHKLFSFSGSLETFAASYLKNKSGADNQYGEIRLLPKAVYTNGQNLLFYVQGDVRLDSASEARGSISGIVDRSGTRRIFDLRETYLELSESILRVRIGKQLFDWSVTDTATVADNLNPRDWNDLIRWERVGVPSLDVRVGTDSFVQAVYVPWFIPSRLPCANDRWSPPAQPGITALNQELPAGGNGQVGVRAGTVMNGVDIGASFYSGYNFSPAARVVPTSPVSAALTPYYRRMEVYGFSVARELFGYNVRVESGYFAVHAGDKSVQFIGGVDREWSTLLRQTDTLYLLFQYSDEIVLSRGSAPLLHDFRRVFVKSAMGKVKYSLDDTREWSLKVEGNYNFRYRDNYLQPAIVWKQNNLEIEAGFDFFAGSSTSFFGGYGANDRGYLKLIHRF
ncbi:MAG TPA: hypothetical protein HPP94_16660 [Desulfuromonadales bacterium]|nr:hypothetical protein [Desulfuromonadales bacterium]